ncbi:MAG: hypothetical protein IKX63_04535, partial [Muribaculaceae bacterium]|nr:hypothetical protein [Muribaculaceae bacterium]
PPGESCVRLNTYSNDGFGGVGAGADEPEDPFGYKFREEEPVADKPSQTANITNKTKRPKRTTWIEKTRAKLEQMMIEDDEDDE